MTYFEKLKSPKWQKKRLEILERDDFSCQNCGDSESSLHVHHTKYIANTDPWEYENDSLVTLCEICHTEITWLKKEVKRIIDEDFVFVEYITELHLLLLKIKNMNPYKLDQLVKSINHE
jgi:hypothetical protein